MDTELLKTFLEVRRTRHFGKAAENLYLTQAAVSARIRQLEEILGVQLFIRNRNNIQLTNEGERLVPHAQTVLLAWSRARQELALETGQLSQVHIGVRYGIWSAALQERLMRLHQDMPGVVLRAEGHVYMDWGSAFARFHTRSFGDGVVPVLRTNISESARAFVAANGGAAYLSPSAVENEKPRLYPVPEAPEYTRKLCAAYRSNSDKLALIESVLDATD